MRLRERIQRDLKFVRGLRRTLKRIKSIASDSPNLSCDDLEQAVDHWRERTAVTFEGRSVTYGEFDQIANRYAHWARGQNLRRGSTVALFMPNRLEYPAIWYGLSKVGVAAALINNQLTGAALRHCLDVSGAVHVLVDAETLPMLQAVRGELARNMVVWTLSTAQGDLRDLGKALKSCSQLRPDRSQREGMTAKETCVYIFTSGTTGLPKAARITHARMQLYMRGFAGATDARPDDRIYIPLPLYHATGGVCAIGAALLNGGSVVLKRRFTASHFWDDVIAENCTMFVYIGELCRYLVNQPEHAGERAHKLRLAFGNGLRPEIWKTFQERFRIPEILEFYGATEGNVSMFNFDGKVGAVGRAPRWLGSRFNFKIVKFDVEREEPVRGANGLCIEAAPDEAGECVGQIGGDARHAYTGYADKIASEKKILHDVFAKGDAYFATGDLLKKDADGYYYFVDRVGDTFRWKGENVSTSEVAGVLAGAAGVKEATVYGVAVEGQEGRAGMASIVVDEDFDLKAFTETIDEQLPAYARPVFLRLQPQIETTGTFKYRKLDLVSDGFDPARTKVPTYFRSSDKGFIKITKTVFEKLKTGGYKL
jgi:fatty-acyl-CoA synthase